MGYAPNIPRDKSDEPIQSSFPALVAKARYAKENATASSCISLTHDTTMITVAAMTKPAVLRWITVGETASATGGIYVAASVISDAVGANFDHVIPDYGVQSFVVPIEAAGTSPSVQGINRELGLYQRVAIKSIGVGSVLLTEF